MPCRLRPELQDQGEVEMEQFLRVGVITSTHALAGEVKVFPTTEDPERFLDLEKVCIPDAKGETMSLVLEVERVRFFKQFVILKFKGLDRIEQVQKLVKKDLYVTREDAIPLEEGEYYIADLIGLQVYDEDGTLLGELSDVLQTGANDVYIVKNGDKELLIPVIADCILNVDLEKGCVRVHLLEGLEWS